MVPQAPPTISSNVLGLSPTSKTFETTTPAPTSLRRIINQEASKRREKGLCFYCDEKFTIGHRCQIYMIEESTLSETIDQYNDQVETEPMESLPEISFHTIERTKHPQTIRVIGKLRNKDIMMLIDGGSIHNFINQFMSHNLGHKKLRIRSFK